METLEARGTWAAKRRLELRLNPAEAHGLEVLRPKVCRVTESGQRIFLFD